MGIFNTKLMVGHAAKVVESSIVYHISRYNRLYIGRFTKSIPYTAKLSSGKTFAVFAIFVLP